MFHKRIATLLMAVAVGTFTVGLAGGSAKADDQTINVDTTQTIRIAQHVASGGLYGLQDGTTPNSSLVSNLKPRVYTQAPPGGQQIPNGEPKAAGDFISIAPTAKASGAKVEIRLADIYRRWPYNYSNLNDWLSKVDTMVNTAEKSGYSDQIYGYEIFNEPNGSYEAFDQSNGRNGNGSWGDFYELWDKTVEHIHKINPNAKIIGPSIYKWDATWMKNFLAHTQKAGTNPDYICWHIGNDGKDIEGQAKQLLSIEKEVGITTPIKLSINEYGERQELAVPGYMIHYMQSFENIPQLDSACMSLWFNYGRLNNLLTDQQQPNGGYWLYKWYADMDGNMVKTSTDDTPSDNLASVANTDSTGNTNVLFGGKSGDTTVNVKGLNSTLYRSNTAHVAVYKTPWYGVDTSVGSPKLVEEGTLSVENGQVTVPVQDVDQYAGYQVKVTPTSSAATGLQSTQTKSTDPIRVEAENSQLIGDGIVKFQGSYASGDWYANRINKAGTGVSFKVNAPAGGSYKFEVGYGSGGQDSVATMKLNDTALSDISFSKTADGIAAPQAPEGNRKVVQYGNVNLKKGENTLTIMYKSGNLQLDYAQFTLNSQTDNNNGNNSNGNNSNNSDNNTTPTGQITGISSNVSSSSSSAATTSSSSSATTPTTTTTNDSSSKEVTTKSFKVYAKKSLYRYKSVNFTKNNRVKKYVVKSRTTAPTFTVVGKAKSANGAARYKLSDGTYITANKQYVANLYWQAKHSKVYALNKTGLYEYKSATLSKKNQVKHVKKGQALRVKKVVKHGSTTRFQLTNGHYITGNKQFTTLTKF